MNEQERQALASLQSAVEALRIQNAQLSQQAEQMQQQNVQIRTELARQVQAQGDLPRLAEQLGDAVQKLSEERKE
eukprot:7036384-Pyramimonas_sp.AAC.1